MKTKASLSRLEATEVNVNVNLMISASTSTRVPSPRCNTVWFFTSQDHKNSQGISVKKQDDDDSLRYSTIQLQNLANLGTRARSDCSESCCEHCKHWLLLKRFNVDAALVQLLSRLDGIFFIIKEEPKNDKRAFFNSNTCWTLNSFGLLCQHSSGTL